VPTRVFVGAVSRSLSTSDLTFFSEETFSSGHKPFKVPSASPLPWLKTFF